MTTPSATPTNDIVDAYQGEYFTKATKQRKGLSGPINRLFSKLFPDTNSKMLLGPFSVGISLAYILPYIFPAAALGISMLAMCTTFVVVGISHFVVRHDAMKKLKQDIADGTLSRRYAEEFLKPKQAALQNTIEALSAQSALTETDISVSFGAKAAPGTAHDIAPVIGTKTPPAPK